MMHLVVLALAPALAGPGPDDARIAGQTGCADIEQFLRTGIAGTAVSIPVGVTRPSRVTLDDGKMQHDAAIQHVHQSVPWPDGGTFSTFKDWWEFNVAAFELAKLLNLNMVAPYVERDIEGRPASLSWWVNGMMEIDRVRKKMEPPDPENWTRQIQTARVFNELTGNVEQHLTNYLIDPEWRLWMIDFSRAFRPTRGLQSTKGLLRCERSLLANMERLDKATLTARLGKYLNSRETDALLTRRDKLVQHFRGLIKNASESAVLFDLPRVGEPCGTGLR